MKKLLALFGLILTVATVSAPAVSAIDLFENCKSDNADQCKLVKEDKLGGNNSQIWTIVSFALGILGGIALIVIIIAGFQYTISQGDSGKVAAAKNTILYAVVALVVAMFAGVIVLFVTGFFS